MLYSCGKKEECDKKEECRKKEEKREETRCSPGKKCLLQEGKKQSPNCAVCREIRPCCTNRRNSIQVNCPELLRWALWSSGFFRCNQCEQSGWRRRRGGSGFC